MTTFVPACRQREANFNNWGHYMQLKLRLVSNAGHPTKARRTTRRDVKSRDAWLSFELEYPERLEDKAKKALRSKVLQNTRVLLIGFTPRHLADTTYHLRSIGVAATASISNVHHLQNVSDLGVGFTHVLVNIDAFDDIETGVEALIAYRSSAPDLVVLVCSEIVGGDDFGSERAGICDATLKLPISLPRLVDGLMKAYLNHPGAYDPFAN